MDAQSSDASDSSNSNDVIDTISAMLVDGLIPWASPNVDDYDVDKPRRVRAPNKARLFEHGEKEFVRKYFCENAVYDEADFERHFRMPRSVFKRIVHGLSGQGLFVQRRDAIKKEGIKPLLRIIASMRILAYGKSFDEVDEICEMIGADSLKFLSHHDMLAATNDTKGFCKACFDGDYPMEANCKRAEFF